MGGFIFRFTPTCGGYFLSHLAIIEQAFYSERWARIVFYSLVLRLKGKFLLGRVRALYHDLKETADDKGNISVKLDYLLVDLVVLVGGGQKDLATMLGEERAKFLWAECGYGILE